MQRGGPVLHPGGIGVSTRKHAGAGGRLDPYKPTPQEMRLGRGGGLAVMSLYLYLTLWRYTYLNLWNWYFENISMDLNCKSNLPRYLNFDVGVHYYRTSIRNKFRYSYLGICFLWRDSVSRPKLLPVLVYPTKGHSIHPPTRNAASWQERRRVPYPKN